jgi:hypothetical protein
VETDAGWTVQDDEIESGVVLEGGEGLPDAEKGVLQGG